MRQTLDDAGGVRATTSYDPWGTPQGTLSAPFGFTGELHRAGQVSLRARWYAPGQGRFVSEDPFAGFPEMPYSLHAYQYGYSNPVRWTDPSGENLPGVGGVSAACLAFIAGDGPFPLDDAVCVALLIALGRWHGRHGWGEHRCQRGLRRQCRSHAPPRPSGCPRVRGHPQPRRYNHPGFLSSGQAVLACTW